MLHRYSLLAAVALAAAGVRASVPAGGAPASSVPAATTTAAQTAPAFRTHFDSGDPMSDFYTAIALRFGVAVIQPGGKPSFIVKPFDLPDKLSDAIAIGQEALAAQGLTLRQSAMGTMIVLSVITVEQARALEAQQGPVSSGTNLEKIDISRPDRMVTHLLPISHTDNAASLKMVAQQTKEVSADIAGTDQTGVTLILSGPAKAVQEAAINVLKVDAPDGGKVIVKTVQLHNINAEETAAALNTSFAKQNAPLKAVGDRRTNSIIVTGPEDRVLDALVGVVSMEASHAKHPPAVEIPPQSQRAPAK